MLWGLNIISKLREITKKYIDNKAREEIYENLSENLLNVVLDLRKFSWR
jgi:hypothetical protein